MRQLGMRLCVVVAMALHVSSMQAAGPWAPPPAAGAAVTADPASQNFDPATFEVLLRRRRCVVAVALRRARAVIATGLVVAPDLVLTARHVVAVRPGEPARRPPGDFEVWVDYRAPPGPAGPVSGVFPVRGFAYASRTLDICLLRIGADAQGRLLTPDRVAGLVAGVAVLDAPVYALHHPGGRPLAVADGAVVLRPYRATPAEVQKLLRRSTAPPDAKRRLRASYRPGPDGTLLYGDPAWAQLPVLLVDTRTTGGSSGAPVFDKRTHAWLGMVFAGGPAVPERGGTGIPRVQAVLAAGAILADLRAGGFVATDGKMR